MNIEIYNTLLNYNIRIAGWENGSICLENINGTKRWYSDSQYHRTNGPAVEYAHGSKHWYLNGKLHRTDGPAIEFSNSHRWWYLDGSRYTKEEFDTIQLKEKK